MIKLTFNGTVLIETEPPPSSQAGVWMTVRCDGITIKAKGPNMAYTLPSDKMIDVQVSYVDSKGNPAAVDGAVTWDSSNADIASVTVDAGESTKANVKPGSSLGQAQISATADADLGAGVTTIVCVMDLNVVAGQAVAGTITPVGEPQPIP